MKLKPEAQNTQTKGAIFLIFIFGLIKGCELHFLFTLTSAKRSRFDAVGFPYTRKSC